MPQVDILQSLSLCGIPPPAGFMEACAKHNITTRKLVSGGEKLFSTDSEMHATVDGYLKDCHEVGYDGIDLDYENLDPAVQDRFTLLMRTLARELHAMGKMMSICVGFYAAMYKRPPARYFYDPDVIAEVCDEIRVMCYDMFYAPYAPSHGIGPTSTRPWAKDAMQFWLERVPREKTLMGLPAYSNDFDLLMGGKGAQIYGKLDAVTKSGNVEKVWMAYEEVNSYRYLATDGRPHLCFASDEASTAAQLKTVDELDIPGITFWHYQSVTPEMWAAVRQWLR